MAIKSLVKRITETRDRTTARVVEALQKLAISETSAVQKSPASASLALIRDQDWAASPPTADSTADVIGWLVSWQMQDQPTGRLLEAWKKSGLPLEYMPMVNTAEMALRESMEAFEKKHSESAVARCSIKTGSDGVRDYPGTPMWILYVADNVLGADLVFVPVLKVWLESSREYMSSTATLVEDRPSQLRFAANISGNRAVTTARALRADYERRKGMVSAETMLEHVVDLAKVSVHAVPYAEHSFFVPAGEMAHWRQITAALQATGDHEFFSLPILKSQESTRTICAAIVREVSRVIPQIVEATKAIEETGRLTRSNSGGFHGDNRWVQHRKRDLAAMAMTQSHVEQQLGIYEKLFHSEESVQDAIVRLRAKLATALLTAENAGNGE